MGRLGLGLGLRLGLITQSGGWSSPMAFKDTGRWQEQLCDTSNHRISGGSSSGLYFMPKHLLTVGRQKGGRLNYTNARTKGKTASSLLGDAVVYIGAMPYVHHCMQSGSV